MSRQMVRLFEPPQNELKREAKGRVMIYDGFTDKGVERALVELFDRLVHMTFIRVIVPKATTDATDCGLMP